VNTAEEACTRTARLEVNQPIPKSYPKLIISGWILGSTIDGTQAEYVRIPHADSSLYPIPDGADEAALVMLSDIFPTGLECGVLNGKVQPGSTVAIVGAGPIGLAAMITAQLYSPSLIIMIDTDANRLKVSKTLGAHHTINPTDGNVEEAVKALTDGKGCDTVIEAVGVPATFETCQTIVAPGGVIANVGVHGTKVDLHLETLWPQNIGEYQLSAGESLLISLAITTRLVDTVTTPMLLKLALSGKLDPSKLITHSELRTPFNPKGRWKRADFARVEFAFKDMEKAYSTFGAAAEHEALKVLIEF
jgi:alcohol dehydrogenase